MPGTLRNRSSFSRHTGLWRMVWRKPWSRSSNSCLSQAMWVSMRGRTAIAALERRLRSATSMVITCCLRAHQRVGILGLGVPEGTPGRTDGFSEVSQDRRVQGIGLGQPASGLGEVPHLARVDHHHRQRGSCQGCHQGQFQSRPRPPEPRLRD